MDERGRLLTRVDCIRSLDEEGRLPTRANKIGSMDEVGRWSTRADWIGSLDRSTFLDASPCYLAGAVDDDDITVLDDCDGMGALGGGGAAFCAACFFCFCLARDFC